MRTGIINKQATTNKPSTEAVIEGYLWGASMSAVVCAIFALMLFAAVTGESGAALAPVAVVMALVTAALITILRLARNRVVHQKWFRF